MDRHDIHTVSWKIIKFSRKKQRKYDVDKCYLSNLFICSYIGFIYSQRNESLLNHIVIT